MTHSIAEGYPLTELADAIGAQIYGSSHLRIVGVNSLEEATSGDLAFLSGHRATDAARQSRASALLVSTHYPELAITQLVSTKPHMDFIHLTVQFFAKHPPPAGMAPNVVRGTDGHIGHDASIGPFVTIGNRTTIGNRVTIYPGVCVGHDVTIGDETVLYPNVSVLDECQVGKRVIIHAGAVIGSDGFGYIQHEGRHHKIPQRGIVVIEDDVELGANVTVDRATFGRTLIKQGSKIDNQVQIAHNVTLGEHGLIVAQVGIAGSTSIGKHVMMGGQAGLIDHLTIGDQVRIAAGTGIEKNVASGATMSGRPAKQHLVSLRTQVLVNHLPELYQQVAALKKRLAGMEAGTRTANPRKRKKSR